MEEDIQNHSPTVVLRGTPCSLKNKMYNKERNSLKSRKY